jgi:peptidyl-prolyl cis-trans isomerase C
VNPLVALSLLLASAGPRGDAVVARVDGAAITAGELDARTRASSASADAARAAILQDLVNEALLAAEAERLGLAKDPRVVAEVDQARRRLAAEAFTEAELWPAARVDDATLKAIFHSQADVVTLRMVTVASEPEAAAALARLREGTAWAEVAKLALDPQQKSRRGELGAAARGQLEPAVEKAAFAAAVGELVGPLRLQLGWAVLQVVDRTIGDDRLFESKKESLRRFGEGQARAQVKGHYLKQLRKEAGAGLDEAFIASTGRRLEATPAELDHPVATLWGKPLRWGEVLPDVLALSRGMTGAHFSGTRVKSEVATQVLDRRLLEEAALRRGFGAAPAVERGLVAARRDALVRARAADLRAGVAKPTAADVEAFYRANVGEFRRAGRRSCAQIVVESRAGVADAQRRLAAGEPFAAVAAALSVERESAARGGELGEIPDDRLDAFAKSEGEAELASTIRKAKPGQVTGPARSRMGFHLLRCGPYTPAGPAPLAEVAAAIEGHLVRERGDQAIRGRFAALRAGARVSIDEAALRPEKS